MESPTLNVWQDKGQCFISWQSNCKCQWRDRSFNRTYFPFDKRPMREMIAWRTCSRPNHVSGGGSSKLQTRHEEFLLTRWEYINTKTHPHRLCTGVTFIGHVLIPSGNLYRWKFDKKITDRLFWIWTRPKTHRKDLEIGPFSDLSMYRKYTYLGYRDCLPLYWDMPCKQSPGQRETQFLEMISHVSMFVVLGGELPTLDRYKWTVYGSRAHRKYWAVTLYFCAKKNFAFKSEITVYQAATQSAIRVPLTYLRFITNLSSLYQGFFTRMYNKCENMTILEGTPRAQTSVKAANAMLSQHAPLHHPPPPPPLPQ